MSAPLRVFTPSTSSSASALLDYVRPDMDAVEIRMQAEVGSDVRAISELTCSLLQAGGKRLRPAMVALAARSWQSNADRDRIAMVGAAVEFVHMATLVHDDVVDNTAMRRGKPTANAIFGNGTAVLSGDYMLARAMRLLAVDGDLRIIRTVSEITIAMSEGEVMEIAATGVPDLPLTDYFEILRKKTAVFVEGCCRAGAILAGATPEAEDALGQYGFGLGMAFQIADDLLDYNGEPALTGKPVGSDLRDGRATLPWLIAMQEASPSERKCLMEAFGNCALDADGIQDVVNALATHDAFNRTREAARQYVETAHSALTVLPYTPARECLEALTDYVVQRSG